MSQILPVLTPSSASLPLMGQTHSIARSVSNGSVSNISINTPLTSSSTVSIPFSDSEEVEVVTEEGLKHAHTKLEARHYKSPNFASSLIETIEALNIKTWVGQEISPSLLKIYKVSGSLTNAVFFVSCPTKPHIRTLLLRIYGPSSGVLISRPRELHTLHILSSQYHIGPRVYGTFENGRVEEFFESTTLTASDLRNEEISRWIGARMAELHSVDIDVVESEGWEIGVTKNVQSWMQFAQDVLNLDGASEEVRKHINLEAFKKEWQKYTEWLAGVDDTIGASRRVFSHNDAQYGNLLRLKDLKPGIAEHRQIIVVDFEYASPNPATFDIANHFHEWTADYHSSTPYHLDPQRYPTREQRYNFYRAYLAQKELDFPSPDAPAVVSESDRETQFAVLDDQVRYWSPASHAMWTIWGLVQAREDVEANVSDPEFDYLKYAQCRVDGFRREIRDLGL